MSGAFTAEGLERLRAAAGQHVGEDSVPGLVALVASGGQVHVEALGRLSVGGSEVGRDSLFRIASTTKPITAAATMTFVDDGALSLDDPVERWLPELGRSQVLTRMDGELDDTVPAERAITVRDLLTFTFGFGSVFEMFVAEQAWPVVTAEQELQLATLGPPDPDVQPDPDTWIARLASLPLMAQPGSRWMYNTGASVLGVLLARLGSAPVGEVLRTRIFEPLGMHDTAFFTTEAARLATAYRSAPSGLAVVDRPDGSWSRPPRFADAASGLVSTVDDLHAFARMLLDGGGTVLSGASVQAMCSDQLSPAQRANGGLLPGFFDTQSWGFCQAVRADGSFGWDGGLGTSWLVDPRRDLVVIVLTQRMFDSAELPAVHRDVRSAAYAALA